MSELPDNLPKGWTVTTIKEITSYVQRGKPPKYVEKSDLPVVNQKSVRWWGVDENHLKYVDPSQWEAWSDERLLKSGDILWNSTGTGTIGRAALFKGLAQYPRIVADSHVTIVRCNMKCIPDYLHYFIRSPYIQNKIDEMQSGSTNQVELSRGEVLQTTIPLPPLDEQRRIVARLDALLARSKRARAELARVPGLVERQKQAVLEQAFSGQLTREWRETHGLPDSPLIKLSEFCTSITDGDHQAPPKATSGVPFITISAINKGRLQLSKATRYVPSSYLQTLSSSRIARKGDVLFSVTGSIAIPALVDTDESFVFQRHIAIIKPNTQVTSGRFLNIILGAPQVTEQAYNVATGTAQLTVPLSGLRNFLIPKLSQIEQLELMRRIEFAFARIDRVAAEAERATALLDRLDQATLARAFRGEL